jgi:DHA1 family inner membrane transport protein
MPRRGARRVAPRRNAERPDTLAALAFANFAVGTGFLINAGLLDVIARDLDVPVPLAGQLVAVYAIAYAIGSPLIVTFTGGIDRRRMLEAGLALIAVGSLAGVAAPSFAWLFASRVVVAIGAGMVTPTASAVTAALSVPERRGRALAFVFGGLTIAQVVGLPLGTFLGQHFGWRSALLLVAGLAFVALVAVTRRIPAGIEVPAPSREAFARLLRDRRALLTLAVASLVLGGQFIPFTYIASYLAHFANADPPRVTLLLFWYGLAAFVGNLIFGRVIDRRGARGSIVITLCVIIATMLLLPAMKEGLTATLAILALWGMFGFGFNPAQQARVVEVAPYATNIALSLNAAALYVGQALGAGIGGATLHRAGIAGLSFAAAAMVAAGLAVALLAGQGRRSRA